MCETMFKVKDIMCKKVVTSNENMSIQEAIKMLNDRHVGSIVILDEEEKCVGIFTERDAIRVVAQKFSLEEPLSKVMSKHVVTLSFEESFDSAKRLILSHKIRHIPVTDQTGKLVGLFSLRAFIDELFGIKISEPSGT